MIPITAGELAQIVSGQVLSGDPHTSIRGLSIDSRKTGQGDVFVAFHGERVDGHRFVLQALQQGASAALVTRPVDGVQERTDKAVIRVDNALDALHQLAIHQRRQFSGPVIGVTGSNGKTTTKDMLATVFSVNGPCLATEGNLNTELGLPMTLLRADGREQSMILEMGMRGLGQIAQLCHIAEPTAGIITNIGQSHLELLGSQERIAQAKGELLEALPRDGVAALTYGDPWLERIARLCEGRVVWYGLSTEADAYASEMASTVRGTRFLAHVLGHEVTVELPVKGRHNVVNALGALLLGAVHGLNLTAMADALTTLPPSVGRLRVLSAPRDLVVIDDCYNASPLSMQASLSVLMELAEGRRAVAILGDMFELGDYEHTGHREVGEFSAKLGVDTLVTVGERAKWMAEAARAAGHRNVSHYKTKEELLGDLAQVVPDGGIVLVKASRGMALEDVVHALTASSK